MALESKILWLNNVGDGEGEGAVVGGGDGITNFSVVNNDGGGEGAGVGGGGGIP